MKKTFCLFALSIILISTLLFSCGGGGGGGVDNAMEDTSFSIGYNANGAESGTAPAVQSGNGKEVLSVSANTGSLAKGGYLFDGWNTSADGSGADYAPGALYNGKNITLYAKWAAIFTYSINAVSPAPSLDGVQQTPGISSAVITGLTERGRQLSSVSIPSSIDGYTISSIGANAFQDCDNLAYVSIPNTVISIGDYAFADCNLLWEITISESVSTIGDAAFLGCNQLSNVLMQRTSPPSMGSDVFVGCNQVFVSVPLAAIDTYNSDPNWNAMSISTPGSLSIIYKDNGADSGEVPPQQRGMAGDVVQIAGNVKTLTRAGCTFNGWNTKADGTGISFAPDANYSFSYEQGDLFLYAQWQHPDYIVSFDSRGADTAASPERITVKAPANTIKSLPSQPYKQYYNFAGWYLNPEGQGDQFVAGSSVTSDMTVYAKWDEGTFYVYYSEYDRNEIPIFLSFSGTCPPLQSSKINTPVIISGNTGNLATQNYRFMGWADSNGTDYAIGSSYSGPQNLNLHGKWARLTELKYYSNGSNSGSAPEKQSGLERETITLRTNTGNLAKTGYSFSGWNTKADGSGVTYAEGASFILPAQSRIDIQVDVNLYPKWTPNPHTVTYNSNGATSGSVPSVQNCVYDQQITFSTNAGNLKRDGYRFGGWNTKANGSGQNYAEGATYTIKGDVELFAKWLPIYTVTFDANGATSGYVPDNQQGIYGDQFTIKYKKGNLQKNGYRIVGWNTESDGSGTTYEDGEDYTIRGNATLYAKWELLYIVSYNSNGATSGSVPSSQQGIKGERITVQYNVGNLARLGYIFECWNTKEDGTGTNYTAGSSNYILETVDVTLYAKWSSLFVEKTNLEIGDIVLSNGKYVSYANFVAYTDECMAIGRPVGVVCYKGKTGTIGTTGNVYMLGLSQGSSWQWAPKETTGYNTKFNTSLTAGETNWAVITAADSIGSADAATNYPAFNRANTYNVSGYSRGWFLPSREELIELYTNRTIINNSITAIKDAGGYATELPNDNIGFWSSSQDTNYVNKAWQVIFGYGYMVSTDKSYDEWGETHVRIVRVLDD